MKDAQPKAIYLKDYQAPNYLIDETHLHFDLGEQYTRVKSRLLLQRNPLSEDDSGQLLLHGANLELVSIAIDGRQLTDKEYVISGETLELSAVPARFELSCETLLEPQKNTSLEGLYKSHTMFCTQCEAEGFRKITYYLDRPDVMSVFTTSIVAELASYPVLLSNGNLTDSGKYEDGRHWATWHDPFKKPSYLFALVAGDLSPVQDRFTTLSGREVDLRIYVEDKDLDKCEHAMRSLKNAMRWDEETYGREYDLDIFNIVAVDDFNMGAMENKSLNIFNTSCVLAKPQTTTDSAFQRVEAVVAHEYFHNWSGNRVTCRDWFQLSLKEGFTVFRDAEFSADMNSATVKRIEDVAFLRTVQFAEDSGPMAHSVRPDSFIEISNFYTVTIYEKGSEVVKMIHTLLGAEDFRKGSDLYFDRHDGQAVTCEDFVVAMEDASQRDLSQFRLWYSQAGTPKLKVSDHYDSEHQTYTLTIKQSCESTPNQSNKDPFHIPLAIGLLGDAGNLPLSLKGESKSSESSDNTNRVLEITQAEQCFIFEDVMEAPVPSLLRGFSAPVKLEYDYSREDLAFIMSRDSDGFCRWDACQQLAVVVIQELAAAHCQRGVLSVDQRLLEAFRSLLLDESLDPAMVALMLNLPSENYLAEIAEFVDVAALYEARESVRLCIAIELRDLLKKRYIALSTDEDYHASAEQIARRSLRNGCLAYLMLNEDQEVISLAVEQFNTADNMTDQFSALVSLVNSTAENEKEQALNAFHTQWQHEPLVVNQWLTAQATCRQPNTIEKIKLLMGHRDFDIKNPNKVRALIGAFCNANPINFHRADGSGYELLGDIILQLNSLNPQVASRMLTPLTRWKKYIHTAELMETQLQRIMEEPGLSKDVYEVVSKSLNS